jgi:hypothetical protein
MRVRDVLRPLFTDEDCVDLNPRRGQLAWPCRRPSATALLALVVAVGGVAADGSAHSLEHLPVSEPCGFNRLISKMIPLLLVFGEKYPVNGSRE